MFILGEIFNIYLVIAILIENLSMNERNFIKLSSKELLKSTIHYISCIHLTIRD